jgi:long-chain acyl-CoA synthetase
MASANRETASPAWAPTTTIALLCERAAERGERTAIFVRRGQQRIELTWNQVLDEVRRAAAALVRLGVSRGDRVVLISPNRYEWIVADLAIQMAQGVHVPVHASLSGPQILHQIVASGATVIILSGEEQTEKLVAEAGQLSHDVKVIAFDACPETWEHFHFLRFSELMHEVSSAEAEEVQARAQADSKPDDLATILFTSGTTGEPKGVMLSQGNLTSNARASAMIFGHEIGDRRLNWLPLSHIFARTCDLYTWLATGCELALADSPEAVVANCAELHPTLLNGVPYFFEKVHRQVVEKGFGDVPGALKHVFGGRMRVLLSGGAPLPDHVAKFYEQQGLLLLQGYGLTESSPVITTSTEQFHRLGTVGRAIPGVEVRISAAGEILTRGPHVMQGYWKNPQATHEAIADGWLHTGDLGELDADGYLHITGRKKELIVTAGGKNIAPAHLEALLTEDPLIRQALVIGDRRNYLTALIVPDFEQLRGAVEGGAETCEAELLTDSRVRRMFTERIETRLQVVSRYEQVRNFVLLDRPFCIEHEELTPTLKLRRSRIQANFADVIEAMYAAKRDEVTG